MKLLDCPLIGRRPISEFDYVGEVRKPPVDGDSAAWSDFVFNRRGAPGVLRERWYHRPTGYWFVFDRDTLTDDIKAVVDAREVRYDIPA